MCCKRSGIDGGVTQSRAFTGEGATMKSPYTVAALAIVSMQMADSAEA